MSANARPFVVGQAISCSGCNSGLYIVSVSGPPTQSTTSGAGQVGNTFTFKTNSAVGGSGSGTITGGCSGASGTGSNCIDFSFSLNTTGATSLATCGVNNLQGSPSTYSVTLTGITATTMTVASSGSPVIGPFTSFSGGGIAAGTYVTANGTGTGGAGTYTITPSQSLGSVTSTATNFAVPNGTCKDPGIGELARHFRIGTTQNMGAGDALAGDFYDDGADPVASHYSQSAAYTCNLVAATVVQCVKGPAYTSGLPSSIGEWLSSGTYASYGEGPASGRIGGIWGPVGGQSLPFTPGSGYTNGTYTLVGSSCGQATSPRPRSMSACQAGRSSMSIRRRQAIGNGITAVCSFPVNFTATASLGGAGNTVLTVTGSPGGALGVGSTITDGGVHISTPVVITSLGTGTGGAGTYNVTNSNGAVSSETIRSARPAAPAAR